MPVYEYVCETCQNRFEQIRPLSQSNDDGGCPDCQGRGHRVISPVITLGREYFNQAALDGIGAGGCRGCQGECGTCGH